MCMAVGKVSFDDCDMLTWSLGWIGLLDPISPPANSMARLEMTSLAFMLVWVPLPVCQMWRGNSSFHLPSATSAEACSIRSASGGSSLPSSRLTLAEAPLRIPKARITGRGIVSSPMSKWCSERAVCAPQYRSAGTSISPMLSLSTRVFSTGGSLRAPRVDSQLEGLPRGHNVRFARPIAVTRDLQHGRELQEGRMAEQKAQVQRPDGPLAHVGVAVPVRTQVDLGVVEVQATQAVQTDDGVEPGHDVVGLLHRGV